MFVVYETQMSFMCWFLTFYCHLIIIQVTVSCTIVTAFIAGDSEVSFTDTIIQLRNGITTGAVSFK